MEQAQPEQSGAAQFAEHLAEYNRQVKAGCKGTVHMDVKLWKLVKQITNLTATLLGFYAIQAGADPLIVFGIVGALLVGPELFELFVIRAVEGNGINITVDSGNPGTTEDNTEPDTERE